MRAVQETRPDIPPGPRHKWWTLAVVGSGTFMSALDTSVVHVALPVIGKATHSPVSTVEWVILSYLITVGSSLLVFGRLADLYGKRVIYMSGQMVFVLGSLGCGLSGDVAWLIAFRAIQAVGAAMIFALGPAILVSAFPGHRRGRALGIQATMTYLGMSIGPALGGFLTHHFGWPSIFYINVPIGLGMWFMAHRVLRNDRPEMAQPFDPVGAAAMAVGLASLLFALSKGGEIGWRNPWVAGLLGLAGSCLALVVVMEKHMEHPALDFRMFSDRMFSSSVLAAYLCYAATASVFFLMPYYLFHAAGVSVSQAGLVMVAVPLAMMAVAALSGSLSDKVGVIGPATAGMALMAAGIGWLGWLEPVNSTRPIVLCLAMIGTGAGLFTAPNNSAIMGSVSANRRGVAGAILAAARTVGFATGVAVAGMIYVAALGGDSGTGTPEEVAHAVRMGMRTTMGLALVAAFCSALRGRSSNAIEVRRS